MTYDPIDLGIFKPNVKVLGSLPNIKTDPQNLNFDVTAQSWPKIEKSPFMTPLFIEAVSDETNTFAAMFPSKRRMMINNFIDDSKAKDLSEDTPYIVWKPVSALPSESVLSDFFDNFVKIDYDPSRVEETTYYGPIWHDRSATYMPSTNDDTLIADFYEWVSGQGSASPETDAADAEDEETRQQLNMVMQEQAHAGIYWGIESGSFISDNMPFWVIINKDQSPTSKKYETIFCISIGLSDEENRFDIILSMNNKPRIVDYKLDRVHKEFDTDLARVLSNSKSIEIGVMTIAGRLVVFVNKVALVYTRVSKESSDEGGSIIPAKITAGPMQIWGTNVSCTMMACPMTFASKSFFALNLPSIESLEGGSSSGGPTTAKWEGVDKRGDPSGSIAEIPSCQVSGEIIYGVDCEKFSGSGGSCSPEGDEYIKQGEVYFDEAKNFKFDNLPNTSFFVVAMKPGDTEFSPDGGSSTIKKGGCPYWFRFKGTAELDSESTPSSTTVDINDYVINVSISSSAPDYFHVKQTATVTCYAPNGIFSDIVNSQKGIRIEMGEKAVFTGIITSYNYSERAGMETITLNCEDYMFILDKVFIVNSPFYDGMLARAAVVDLAERAGCEKPSHDWSNEDEYFLPSGFAYTQPLVRFPPSNTIKECILNVIKRFEAYFYFDEDGKFVIKKLPGGLMSEADEIVKSFVVDADHDTEDEIVISEKNATMDYNSTVNVVSIYTLDRNTRNAAFYTKTADGDNKILFRRTLLLDQGAYGEIAVARSVAEEIGQRVFSGIQKTTFKTIGGGGDVLPMQFIDLEGQEFRVMSIKREYSAETNSLTTDYECEWLGG